MLIGRTSDRTRSGAELDPRASATARSGRTAAVVVLLAAGVALGGCTYSSEPAAGSPASPNGTSSIGFPPQGPLPAPPPQAQPATGSASIPGQAPAAQPGQPASPAQPGQPGQPGQQAQPGQAQPGQAQPGQAQPGQPSAARPAAPAPGG